MTLRERESGIDSADRIGCIGGSEHRGSRMHAHLRIHLVLASVLSLLVVSGALGEPLPRVQRVTKIGSGIGGFPDVLADKTLFGWSIESIGDLDGDGAPEVAMGATFDGGEPPRFGAVWTAEVAADGTVREPLKIGGADGGFVGTLDDFDRFGITIANLGDIDGDDTVELAIGAPGDDDGGANTGALYIVSLDRDRKLRRSRKISPRRDWARSAPWTWLVPDRLQGGLFAEIEAGALFGINVESIGDLDGDGVPELAVGGVNANAQGRERGGLWILFLDHDATLRRYVRLDTDPELAPLLDKFDLFGTATAAPGDIDADGVPDLIVGAPGDDDACEGCGAIYVLSLQSNGTLRGLRKISAGVRGFKGDTRYSAAFGIALEAMSPPSADGFELAVGAREDGEAGGSAGAFWLLRLSPAAEVVDERKYVPGRAGLEIAVSKNDGFGGGLSRIGDLDGNGVDDLMVGAEGDDEAGTDTGAVRVLFFERDTPSTAQ